MLLVLVVFGLNRKRHVNLFVSNNNNNNNNNNKVNRADKTTLLANDCILTASGAICRMQAKR